MNTCKTYHQLLVLTSDHSYHRLIVSNQISDNVSLTIVINWGKKDKGINTVTKTHLHRRRRRRRSPRTTGQHPIPVAISLALHSLLLKLVIIRINRLFEFFKREENSRRLICLIFDASHISEPINRESQARLEIRSGETRWRGVTRRRRVGDRNGRERAQPSAHVSRLEQLHQRQIMVVVVAVGGVGRRVVIAD